MPGSGVWPSGLPPEPVARATWLARRVLYELGEEVLDVLLALKRLTPKQRATVVLFYLDDRPTEEIGRVLGMSATTVSCICTVHGEGSARSWRKTMPDLKTWLRPIGEMDAPDLWQEGLRRADEARHDCLPEARA